MSKGIASNHEFFRSVQLFKNVADFEHQLFLGLDEFGFETLTRFTSILFQKPQHKVP